MTNILETSDFNITVRNRGGSGTKAMWQWEVRANGNSLILQKGIITGVENRAHEAGQKALERLQAKRAEKAKA